MSDGARDLTEKLLAEVQREFEGPKRRKYAAGLFVSLIDFMLDLDTPKYQFLGADDFYAKFPRQEFTSGRKGANTLIVRAGERTSSIRPFYNRVESYFRNEMKRYDYPSAAPHATQAWSGYPHWIDQLVTLDQTALVLLRQGVVDFVLKKLPSQDVDMSGVKKEPAAFAIFLDEFDFSAKRGEPTGSAFQGAVFAFIRAASPHLQVEVDKTRTGSKRVDRVGDVDVWDGGNLIQTCEVKHLIIANDSVDGFKSFAAAAHKRNADAFIMAEEFGENSRLPLEELGIRTMSMSQIIEHVKIWDPLKQRNAMKAFEYFVSHKELNSSLTARFKSFCREKGFESLTMAWAPERISMAAE